MLKGLLKPDPFLKVTLSLESTTSLLTAATLEYTRGAGITAAAGT